MTKLCNAAGCSKAVRYGELCSTHALRKGNMGDADLVPVKRTEVRQYRTTIEREMIRTKVQEDIDAFFETMLDEQKAIVAEMNRRGFGHLDAYYAALDFVDAENDRGRNVLLDLMGLGWLMQVDPNRLTNPEAITLTATKVLRWSLVKGAKRSMRKTGQIDVSKRKLSRSAKRHLGNMLVPTLVSFGYAMAKTWVEHETAKDELKRGIMEKITKTLVEP
jgi:hypothetical protein